MQNPLESEEAAFRFVLGALVYFAAIVVAAWVATWLGVIVFVVMSVLAFVVLRRGTASVPPVVSTERAAVEDTRRILVVTDALPLGPGLRRAILRVTGTVTDDVLLIYAVAPSAAGAGGADGGGPSDVRRPGGSAARASCRRDQRSRLPRRRRHAPALEDALRGFDADEVVLSITTAAGRPMAGSDAVAPSAPSGQDFAEADRSLFDGPVTAIVDDRAEPQRPSTGLAQCHERPRGRRLGNPRASRRTTARPLPARPATCRRRSRRRPRRPRSGRR